MYAHQYVQRQTGQVVTEAFFGDRFIRWLYGPARERAPAVFKALTSARASRLLSYYNFDCTLRLGPRAALKTASTLNIDLKECLAPEQALQSIRNLFERKILYWKCRPMPEEEECVVSPADAKMLVGSLEETNMLAIKEKFFDYVELIGGSKRWLDTFRDGAFALFRLTPENYHYNHVPVSGRVVDFYALTGDYHSCNPGAIIAAVSPYSKNKRTVTIIDTDVPGGTGVGWVAMVEVVALMVGDIVQCYSDSSYDDPVSFQCGLFVRRGQPKSLFRPGSSVVVLFFQKDRMAFDEDLMHNSQRTDVRSRYSSNFNRPLVETEIRVRCGIGRRKDTQWI